MFCPSACGEFAIQQTCKIQFDVCLSWGCGGDKKIGERYLWGVSSKRTFATHAVHEPAPSVMNAVEYCLLHGLKLAGPEHPAILCAQESLSYGAAAARQPVRHRLARGGRSSQ